MDETEEVRFGRFDIVSLRTTKNITYLSAPDGANLSPHGEWVVAAAMPDNSLIITKNNVTVRVPAIDVFKIANYTKEHIISLCGRLSSYDRGQRGERERGREGQRSEEEKEREIQKDGEAR